MIPENAYWIFLPPNIMEPLVSYGESMVITDLLLNLTGTSSSSKEDAKINLVCNTMWLIQNPQRGYKIHWIYAAKE